MVRLLILTGARLREIGNLHSDEIKGNTIELPAERVKNGKPFILPLSKPAVEIIAGRMKAGLLFARDGKTGLTDEGRLKRELDKRIAEMTGAALPDWHLHDLRRSVATHMAESPGDGGLGIQPHIVEAVLNHISGHKGGVAGIYNRASYLAEKRQALAMWADHVLALVAGRKSNVLPMQRA